MHKKSPTGGEETLYIPFKFYRKAACVSNKRPSCHSIKKKYSNYFQKEVSHALHQHQNHT